MKTAGELQHIAVRIIEACGAPPAEAAMVAHELVETNLLGLDSHGIVRIPQYVNEVLIGKIKPGAPVTLVKETTNTAVVDCGFNFGAVSAGRMVDIALDKARDHQIVCITSKRSRHIGRLGAYVQKIAEHGMIALGFANGYKRGHSVAPWGGREGRLATNPLAYAVPTSSDPVVFDMSTSMIAEGRLRILKNRGEPIPPGRVLDASGNPTTDPDAFYGPPMGTILPFGSELGYKGFGLGLLVEILGSTLVGEEVSDNSEYTNGLCLIVINPESFSGTARFTGLMDQLSDYMGSCPPAPGHDGVKMPGQLDFAMKRQRLVEGIPIEEETWALVVQAAAKVDCDI
ncbi:MAG: dehydrogenase [Paenibacillus sp.]|jgi:uncharacterized oxidoreductase|nr:dehydrogenase [Paenibacillus sp.]